ncbi:unnamed protein product [Callosobruchus maculatus]|uniref:Uncharacterized protein n=1 Tax=Callosobruchus maculatus TaxID=64391 RepID=A0A653CYC5_CALMS|nr:unnamed protein product [Callosobruchus maculatus]
MSLIFSLYSFYLSFYYYFVQNRIFLFIFYLCSNVLVSLIFSFYIHFICFYFSFIAN